MSFANRIPETLIKYQPSVEIYESMKQYHKNLENQQQNIENPPDTQSIINAIFPPRDWTDNFNKLHIQYVSHQPASRQDVLQLREKLNKMLEDRQAKNSGICGIREQLFCQTFDQIIRQVAIDCPERGILLMRVRDQHKMTLAAYQTVYQSSVCYGITKLIESDEGNGELEIELQKLEQKKKALEDNKDQLLCNKQLLQRKIKECKAIEGEKRQEEIKFLHLQVQNLSKFLQTVKSQLRNPIN